MKQIWKKVELFVAFHVDKAKRKRRIPFLWTPKNGTASVADRERQGQEAFVVVTGAEGQRDVQIKVHPDKIIVRRDDGSDWRGVVIKDYSVAVRAAGRWIEIRGDGSVQSTPADDMASPHTTLVAADGEIYRWDDLTEIIVSSDGDSISRRRATDVVALSPDGLIVQSK